MKIGLQISWFNWPGSPENIGSKLIEIATTADELGFDSLWTMDHFFQIDRVDSGMSPEDPMLDSYTVLSYMAAATKHIRLGTMVTGAIYRHPGHLVKIVTSLDVLSGGRANLGIGTGWYEREAMGLGFPFPPLKERFERLEETLQIAKLMWSDEVKPFNGKHFQLAETLNHPMPFSKPHPPILVGGMGEKKSLRLVAKYADACNFATFRGIEMFPHKLEVLKRHCEDIGRDYEEIEKTALGSLLLGEGGMSPDEVIQTCEELAGIGFQHFILSVSNLYEIRPIEIIGREVIPAIAGL